MWTGVSNVLKQNAGEVERTLLAVSAEVARNFVGKAEEISTAVSQRAAEMTYIVDEKSSGLLAALTNKSEEFVSEVSRVTEHAVTDRVTRLTNADRARASGATLINTYSATLADPALNGFGADYWKGGKITFAPGFGAMNSTCDVTASASGSVTLQCNPDPASGNYRTQWALPPGNPIYRPHAGNSYYLWGKRAALDAPGEWFREGTSTAGTLYLRMPDGSNPAGAKVEARRRLWAFDLFNRGYITIDGIKLFAATLRTGDYNSFAHHITVQNIEARYLWHFQEVPPLWHEDGTHGLDFGGTDNVVRDSYLAFSAGPLLRLFGARNRAENNVLRDGSYMGNAPMATGRFSNQQSAGGADRNVLTGNTLFNSGQVLIHASAGFDILYNDGYNSHLQIMDLGTVYAQGTDGKQAQIAYNTLHDNRAELNPALTFWGGFGIYLDDGTSNYVAHHNAVWNVTADGLIAQGGITANFPSGTSRKFINNTVDGSIAVYRKSGTTLLGTVFKNNYATENLATDPEVTVQANRFDAQLVVTTPGQDYTLRAGSPAIDAGVVLPGYTDGYVGAAPDVGSYEYGANAFLAGAVLRPVDLAGLSVACSMKSATTAACTIRNLPVGRKLPSGFALRVGSSGAPGDKCWTVMDYGANVGTGTCDPVSTAGLSGVQTVYARLTSGQGWQVTSATLDLGSGGTGLALDSVSPAVVPIGGGVTLTLRGRAFDTAETGYLQPVTVTNSCGVVLANYQTLVTLDTAALIAQGRLRADCGDLRFGDATGSLPYWLEDGCNTNRTRVWVKAAVLPKGDSRIDLTYGAPGHSSASSGPGTFQFFDDFEDGQIDTTHWIATSGGWYTVAERNGGLCISGTTNASTQYNAVYMKLKLSSIILPATYAIDSELALNQSPAKFKAAAGTDDLMAYAAAQQVWPRASDTT